MGSPAPVGVPPLLSLVLVDHILSCLLGACSLVSPTHARTKPKPKPKPKPTSLTCPSHPESSQTASPLRMSVACPQALTHELSHTRPLTPLKLALIHGASVRLNPTRIAHALAHAHALACADKLAYRGMRALVLCSGDWLLLGCRRVFVY